MTIERFREAVQARPFKPFTLYTADGRVYHVSHPEFILLAPKAERTFVLYNAASRDPEHYVVLDLLLISAIEFGGQARQRRKAS